ncbi:inactive protein RESTRICTED TEV MOVEMENT 2-like [Euphorbia lathyris]|uniref:inactive protein RESTRICTED TEV MOVEMENT 2-like n=1 Tax=Euphorbia lathyris TaxID=212925 RepID=UPI00331382C8
MDSRQKERTFEDFDPTIEWEKDATADILKIYLPGFRKEQLKVQVTTTRLLRISGERELGDNKGIKFRKEIPISSNYDTNDITAKFERGILFIKHPKSIIPDRKPQPPLPQAATPLKDAPKPPKPPQPKPQPPPPPPPQEKSKQPPPTPKIESPKPETPKIEPLKTESDATKTRIENKIGGSGKGNAIPEKVGEKKDNGVSEIEKNGQKEKKSDEIAAGITNDKLGGPDSVCGNVGNGEKVAAGIVTGVQRSNYREVLSDVVKELKDPRKLMESVMTVLLIVMLWVHAMIMKPIRHFRNSGK